MVDWGCSRPNDGKIHHAFFMGKSTKFRLGHGFNGYLCMFTRPGNENIRLFFWENGNVHRDFAGILMIHGFHIHGIF